MNHLKRYFTSVALLSALAVPVALSAQDRDHDRDDANRRIYDRQYRDYHNWNKDEDGRYRQWYGSQYNGREYRDYNRLSRKQQNDYWKWRHKHNDHDADDRH